MGHCYLIGNFKIPKLRQSVDYMFMFIICLKSEMNVMIFIVFLDYLKISQKNQFFFCI